MTWFVCNFLSAWIYCSQKLTRHQKKNETSELLDLYKLAVSRPTFTSLNISELSAVTLKAQTPSSSECAPAVENASPKSFCMHARVAIELFCEFIALAFLANWCLVKVWTAVVSALLRFAGMKSFQNIELNSKVRHVVISLIQV